MVSFSISEREEDFLFGKKRRWYNIYEIKKIFMKRGNFTY
jgi:hypothetical protein